MQYSTASIGGSVGVPSLEMVDYNIDIENCGKESVISFSVIREGSKKNSKCKLFPNWP